MPENRDIWWSVRSTGATSDLGATIRALLEERALPFLDERVSDEGLRDHWLRRSALGSDGLALASLLRDLGPREHLEPLLARLRAETPPRAILLLAAIDKFSASLATR